MAVRIRIIHSVIILFIVSFFLASTSYSLDNPAFFKGFRHMSKRSWDEAIMYFNVSIRREPDYLPAYSQLASCYERKKDFVKAKEVWAKYAEFDSYFKDAVIIHIKLIDDYLRINELSPTEAIATLENIIEKDKYPSSVLFLYAAETLSQLYFNNNLHVRAIPLLDKIMLYYAQDVTEDILFKLAYSHQKEGEYQKALDTYKRLDKEFKLSPEYVDKCKNLASLCYEALGDEAFAVDEWDKARENYILSIKGFPGAKNVPRVTQKELRVQEQLAFVYKTEGDSSVMEKNYSEAVEFYLRVVDECPQSSQCGYAMEILVRLAKMERDIFNDANNLYQKRKYELAIKGYKKLVEVFPESEYIPWAYLFIGFSYASVENYQRSIISLAQLPRNYPEHSLTPVAVERIGVYYWQVLKKPERALKMFNYLIKKHPESQMTDNALYYSGIIYLDGKKYEKAYMRFRAIIKQFPDSNLARRAKLGIKHVREEMKEVD